MRTVLRAGSVIDGTNSAARAVDVAFVGQRITEVGFVDHREGDVDVDVSGLVVSPGFIDPHTHYDAQILWDPSLSPSCWHGVTTVVMGNCGFGIAPTRVEHRGVIARTLENVEGMSVEALEAGIRWNFVDFADWMQNLAAIPKRLNVLCFIGHTPLRLFVLGQDAVERPASAAEARAMRQIVSEAIDLGAVGFSSSMAPNHQGDGGRPVPSRGADWAELTEVLSALRDTGRGVFQSTPGPDLFLDEFAEIAEQTGRPVTWGALLTRGGVPWPTWSDTRGSAIELLRMQRERSTEVWPQISCRDFAMELELSDPLPFSSLAVFKELLALPRDQRAARCAEPDWHDRAREQMDGYWGHRWGKTTVVDPDAPDRGGGPSLLELAERDGRHPFDVMMSIALEHDLHVRFKFVIGNDDEDELAELLRDHGTLLSLSDAGAHASQLSDACYATHLLGHWVRDKGVIPLHEAIWRLTGQVADLFGISDRGRIAPDAFADLVVFDPDTVSTGPLERVYDLPAGADRLISHATGIMATWVNGTCIHADGIDTELGDALPGVLVKPG